MPKIQKGKSYKKKYTEEEIQKAIEAIQIEKKEIREVSRIYNIPRSTLQFRLGTNFIKTQHGPSTVLTNAEEKTLVKWILVSSEKGFPRRKENVLAAVKDILDINPRENSFPDNTPGRGWYQRFLGRHPEITIRTSEAVSAASSKVSEMDIRGWFSNIEQLLRREELLNILEDPDRIFNGDETNFLLCPKSKQVLALKGQKSVYEVDNAVAKTNLTVMLTFSASGAIIPPMIIFPYKRVPDHIAEAVPNDWGIGKSDNGWMKSEVFYEYVTKVFYAHIIKNGVQLPVILFVDGHCTHLTFHLSEACHKLGIILIALYPNATRILQPADVACFKPLKNGWNKALIKWRIKNPTENFTTEKFAPLLKTVIDTSLQKDTIKQGFKACGLYPWKCDNIDFSKCLGHNSKEVNSVGEKNKCGYDDIVLNYKTFVDIVGADSIKKFESFNISNNSSEYAALNEIWLMFGKERNANDSSIIINNVLEEETPLTEPALNSPVVENVNEIINIPEVFDIENMQIIFESNTLSANVSSLSASQDRNQNIESAAPLRMFDPNTTSQNVIDILNWPESPRRTGKRQTERTSFVVSSNEFRNDVKKKQDKKRKIEEEKENRKKIRMKNKEAMAKVKSMKKENTKLGMNKKGRKVPKEIDFNKTEEKENISDELEVNPFTKNTAVNGNLCYICCLIITTKKVGIKCQNCIRTFHSGCILKKDPNNKTEIFKCQTCQKKSIIS